MPLNKLSILSPAKLNLYFDILGKLKDGYHKVYTVMERVSLFDELKISLTGSGEIDFRCSNSDVGRDNTITKAYYILKRYINRSFGVDVFLKKRIPIGSGMGGASSNAAFFIFGVLKILNIRLPEKELYSIGERIGADVNFFLSRNRFAICANRGEKVTPLVVNRRYAHYVIFPKVFSSTKRVYEEFDGALTRVFNDANILIYGLKKRDFLLIDKGIFNALKMPAFSVNPCLRRVETFLRDTGARAYGMTGSGSAFFLFDDKTIKETTLYRECKSQGWEVFRVQTY
jgi:4-diphosphocytidyl-2-C-methyl-D-erythritol kinase